MEAASVTFGVLSAAAALLKGLEKASLEKTAFRELNDRAQKFLDQITADLRSRGDEEVKAYAAYAKRFHTLVYNIHTEAHKFSQRTILGRMYRADEVQAIIDGLKQSLTDVINAYMIQHLQDINRGSASVRQSSAPQNIPGLLTGKARHNASPASTSPVDHRLKSSSAASVPHSVRDAEKSTVAASAQVASGQTRSLSQGSGPTATTAIAHRTHHRSGSGAITQATTPPSRQAGGNQIAPQSFTKTSFLPTNSSHAPAAPSRNEPVYSHIPADTSPSRSHEVTTRTQKSSTPKNIIGTVAQGHGERQVQKKSSFPVLASQSQEKEIIQSRSIATTRPAHESNARSHPTPGPVGQRTTTAVQGQSFVPFIPPPIDAPHRRRQIKPPPSSYVAPQTQTLDGQPTSQSSTASRTAPPGPHEHTRGLKHQSSSTRLATATNQVYSNAHFNQSLPALSSTLQTPAPRAEVAPSPEGYHHHNAQKHQHIALVPSAHSLSKDTNRSSCASSTPYFQSVSQSQWPSPPSVSSTSPREILEGSTEDPSSRSYSQPVAQPLSHSVPPHAAATSAPLSGVEYDPRPTYYPQSHTFTMPAPAPAAKAPQDSSPGTYSRQPAPVTSDVSTFSHRPVEGQLAVADSATPTRTAGPGTLYSTPTWTTAQPVMDTGRPSLHERSSFAQPRKNDVQPGTNPVYPAGYPSSAGPPALLPGQAWPLPAAREAGQDFSVDGSPPPPYQSQHTAQTTHPSSTTSSRTGSYVIYNTTVHMHAPVAMAVGPPPEAAISPYNHGEQSRPTHPGGLGTVVRRQQSYGNLDSGNAYGSSATLASVPGTQISRALEQPSHMLSEKLVNPTFPGPGTEGAGTNAIYNGFAKVQA